MPGVPGWWADPENHHPRPEGRGSEYRSCLSGCRRLPTNIFSETGRTSGLLELRGPTFLFILVTVAIAITIAVTVTAIAYLMGNGSVQDEGHVVQLLAAVDLFEFRQHAAVEFTYPYHEDGEVGNSVGDGSIGDDSYRYVIDEDIVVTGTELGNQFFQPFAQQQFGRIRSGRTGRNQIQVLAYAVFLDNLIEVCLTGQVGGHPFGMVFLGPATQGALADIEVDQDDFLLGLGKAGRQVGRYVGLTGSRTERTEGHHLQVLGFHPHKVHVGTDDTEGFGHNITSLDTHHNVFLLSVHLLGLLVGILRYFSQERYAGGIFDVLAVTDAGIEEEQCEEDNEWQGSSLYDTAHDDGTAVWRYRGVATTGRVEYSGIGFGGGLRQGIFFTLVQQVEVQFFLDAVLTVNVQHLALLFRNVRYSVGGLSAHGLGFVQLGVDAHDGIVYRPDDVLTHGVEALVQFLYHRVLVATAFNQLVTFQLVEVVGGNLALDVHVNTGIGRDEFRGLGRVGEVILDETGHALLHFQFLGLAGELLLLRHGHAGSGTDINHVVFQFEGFNLGFHIVQFLGNLHQTFVDEVFGIDGNLVLVLDGLFVVDGDEGVQYIFGTDGREITQRGIKNCCIIVGLAYAKIG